MNQKKQNNITNNTYSDEWYTDQDTVNLCLKLLKPEIYSTVMCPFDSENSLFVKTLQAFGHNVIYGIQDYVGSTDPCPTIKALDVCHTWITQNPKLALEQGWLKNSWDD